jgi:hypothetical protein
MTASILGARLVYLTDVSSVIDSLKHNVYDWNGFSEDQLQVTELNWKDMIKDSWAMVNIVLASDVIWVEDLVAPFVRTISGSIRKF